MVSLGRGVVNGVIAAPMMAVIVQMASKRKINWKVCDTFVFESGSLDCRHARICSRLLFCSGAELRDAQRDDLLESHPEIFSWFGRSRQLRDAG